MSTLTPPTRRRTNRVRAALAIALAGSIMAGAGCSGRTSIAAARPTATPKAVTTTTTAPDHPDRRALLSRILESHLAAGEFVGARMALRDADGTVTEVTAGAATNDGAGDPVDVTVPWNVGSITKVFVAVVVLQLAQEGRLDLDAGIEAMMPGLPGADSITPRQLLQHTSGLNEYIDQPAVLNDARRHWSPSELIAVAETAGRVGAPGERYHYSNTNYIVLGELIEKITGHTWATEVRRRITKPLGMKSTTMIGRHEATGYSLVDGRFTDATDTWDTSVGGAAGSMQSTDADLLRLITALHDHTLLTPATTAEMQAFIPGEDYSAYGIVHGYGLGFERYQSDAVTVYGHMGVGRAHGAFVGYDTATGTSVAVGINSDVPGPQAVMAVEALTAVGHTT